VVGVVEGALERVVRMVAGEGQVVERVASFAEEVGGGGEHRCLQATHTVCHSKAYLDFVSACFRL
jgi:hypothetical protein